MKKAALPCAAFYALYYGVNAVYMGYISKYYQQQGISHGALTLLLLCFPVLSMFSLPFWGARSDGSGRPRVILQGVILLSALLMPFLAGGHLLFACAALACCYPAIQPLGDSLILHSLQKNGQPFGPVRLVGSLAFSAVNLLYGYLLRDDYSAVPWTVCAGLGGLLAVSFLLPKEKESRREKGSFREVLRLPHMVPLMLLVMALQLTLGVYYNFYPLYFTALPGAASGWLGLAYFLGSMSELPFILRGDRLFMRFGPGPMLLAAALCLGLRYLLLGLADSLPLALFAQLLHGGGFIVITFAMARYISREAPPAVQARGQTLLAVAGFGLSRACGVLLGGCLSAHIGLHAAFLLMSGLALGSFFIFFPLLRRVR